MKRLIIILSVLFVAIITLFLGGKENRDEDTTFPKDNRDEEMVGPQGEEIFIGSGGGRYFVKNGRKIYIGYKAKKQMDS